MEYEATFPFEKNATLCNQYAFSKNEVKDFVSYCSSIGIEVIPLQNCFGHSEYILRHDRYSSIREDDKEVSQVCPVKIEEAKKIFTSIFKEVADLHPSKYFHIGCDETYLLGSCPDCKAKVKEFGESKLFVDYVNAMADIVIKMGKTPVIWADIILKHPEAINELRKEIVFVDWNYGWDINRFGKLDNLLKNNVTIWGATAMRSHPDQMYLTQWNKHLGNLTTFIPFTRQSGYKGIINTSWSTGGTYGFHYDTYNEIINMQPIRSVYPQSGFNFLVEAFCDAINSNKTFDEKDFALKYAHRRFGFDDKGCQIFYEYMMMPQEIIRRGGIDEKNVPVEKVYNDCVALRKKFAALVPKTNRTEFEHLLLMLDIRINYLGFKKLKKSMNRLNIMNHVE
jgi:hexosaminidase